jgi:hypothetical protein
MPEALGLPGGPQPREKPWFYFLRPRWQVWVTYMVKGEAKDPEPTRISRYTRKGAEREKEYLENHPGIGASIFHAAQRGHAIVPIFDVRPRW